MILSLFFLTGGCSIPYGLPLFLYANDLLPGVVVVVVAVLLLLLLLFAMDSMIYYTPSAVSLLLEISLFKIAARRLFFYCAKDYLILAIFSSAFFLFIFVLLLLSSSCEWLRRCLRIVLLFLLCADEVIDDVCLSIFFVSLLTVFAAGFFRKCISEISMESSSSSSLEISLCAAAFVVDCDCAYYDTLIFPSYSRTRFLMFCRCAKGSQVF